MRRLAVLAGAVLLFATVAPAQAADLTSPDIELTGDEPVVVTANASMLTLEFAEVVSGDDPEETVTRPMTCDLKVAQKFHGTRNATTKVVSGRFDFAGSTKCSGSLGMSVVATLHRNTFTAVRSAPVDACNSASSGTPCTAVATAAEYQCAACATGSWTTKSTHRITVALNVYLVNPPANCSQANATTVECVLTSSRTTIK